MFKLKPENKELKEKLKLADYSEYDYVLTTEKDETEDDKLNILFQPSLVHEVNDMLDLLIKGEKVYLTGTNERGMKRVEVRNVYYVESFKDDVYLVLRNERLLTHQRLYEFEEMLETKDFIRVSKSHVVNIGKIKYIQPQINSIIRLDLNNGEEIEVKRTYLKAFKEALKI